MTTINKTQLDQLLSRELTEYAEYIRQLSHYIHQTITSPDPSPASIQIAADELKATAKHYLLATYSR